MNIQRGSVVIKIEKIHEQILEKAGKMSFHRHKDGYEE